MTDDRFITKLVTWVKGAPKAEDSQGKAIAVWDEDGDLVAGIATVSEGATQDATWYGGGALRLGDYVYDAPESIKAWALVPVLVPAWGMK